MKPEIMHEQEHGWKTYYTIPSKYDDFCEYFRTHCIIGKHFPKVDEDFAVQMFFEPVKDEAPGWYLLVCNYTKRISIEFHVYKMEKEFPCCEMRSRKHGLFRKWTDWKILK